MPHIEQNERQHLMNSPESLFCFPFQNVHHNKMIICSITIKLVYARINHVNNNKLTNTY